MNYQDVDHVTSNEQYVRLRIYEGFIPVDEADRELRTIEIAQLQSQIAILQRQLSNLQAQT